MVRIKCRETGEEANSYADYLRTRHWARVRERALQKAKGRCRNCKRELSNGFIAHHDSTGAYRRVGRERIGHWLLPDDVIAVCRVCHDVKFNALLHWGVKVPIWARKEE
jgi:hypothetical protein